MNNVLFNRETLKVVGLNRPAFPFEIEVSNVVITDLTKQVSYTEIENKTLDTEVDGEIVKKQLYVLPQEDKEITKLVKRIVETTEFTEQPVMIKTNKKVPLLNEDGSQMKYEVTYFGETTEVTDEPIMIPVQVEKEDGTVEIEEVQKTDEDGNLLYNGMVKTGNFIDCFTSEEIEVQKKDAEDNLLYYQEVEEYEITYEKQEPLEITEDDERWPTVKDVEDNDIKVELEKATIEVPKIKAVNFAEHMTEFTYDEVVAYKEKCLINGTFFSEGLLIETMNEELFSTNLASFNASLGVDFVSLPVGGEVRTIKLTLPQPAMIVGVRYETSDTGIEVKIGATTSDMKVPDSNKERYFDSEVTEMYINFKNTSNKRIDLFSFALLV